MIRIKRPFHRLLLLIVFMTLLVSPLVHADPGLNITVATDKSSYGIEESVEVYANLTSGVSPVQDGLVALEVAKPAGSSLLFRTLQTETPPTSNEVNITEVILMDMAWQPKDSFNIGESGRFLIKVNSTIPSIMGDVNLDGIVNVWDLGYLSDAWLSKLGDLNYNPYADFNHDNQVNVWDLGLMSDYWLHSAPVLRVWVTMTMYDGENAPFTKSLTSFQLAPYLSQAWMGSFNIPPVNVSTGNAAVYACAFTNLPNNEGTPYCPEKSKAFTITGSMSSGVGEPSGYQTTATSGNYNSTFKIPPNANPGTYTVYVASSYQGEQATANTTFEVTTP